MTRPKSSVCCPFRCLSLTASCWTIRSCSTNRGKSRLNHVHSKRISLCYNCIVCPETRFVLSTARTINSGAISRQLNNRDHSRLVGSTSTVWRHCLLQNSDIGKCKGYYTQYPVLGICQSTLHLPHWQTCLVEHHLGFSGKHPAMLL